MGFGTWLPARAHGMATAAFPSSVAARKPGGMQATGLCNIRVPAELGTVPCKALQGLTGTRRWKEQAEPCPVSGGGKPPWS